MLQGSPFFKKHPCRVNWRSSSSALSIIFLQNKNTVTVYICKLSEPSIQIKAISISIPFPFSQRGRVVRALDLKSGGPTFKSSSDRYLELFLVDLVTTPRPHF